MNVFHVYIHCMCIVYAVLVIVCYKSSCQKNPKKNYFPLSRIHASSAHISCIVTASKQIACVYTHMVVVLLFLYNNQNIDENEGGKVSKFFIY